MGESGLAKALSSQLALVGLQRFGSIVLEGLTGTASTGCRTGGFRSLSSWSGSFDSEEKSLGSLTLDDIGTVLSEETGGSEG